MNWTRKNSQNSQNNPTNIMRKNSNRRNSTASDPGLSFDVVGTKNWLNRRPANKNTTLKNIRNRIKAKNTAALTQFLNQKPAPSPPLPKINNPKMMSRNQPYLLRKAKNIYNAAKFRFQTKKQVNAGMKLLTEERAPKINHLHPNYYKDSALNRINAEFNRDPETNRVPGSRFV